MEKVIDDLNYCAEYYKTIEEDSKCCGGITYDYISKCCNSTELNNVYEIVMKLFATNYIITFDYNLFLCNFNKIFRKIFFDLKREEVKFLKKTMYYDTEYVRKMRYLHIYDLYKNILPIGEIYQCLIISYDNLMNHSRILLEMFYKLYLDNLLEENDILNCFNGGMRICHNIHLCNMDRHPLKEKYELLIKKEIERLTKK